MNPEETESGLPAGELRFRAAEQIGVSFPKRTIELIVTPYEREALVPNPRGRGMITEIFADRSFLTLVIRTSFAKSRSFQLLMSIWR